MLSFSAIIRVFLSREGLDWVVFEARLGTMFYAEDPTRGILKLGHFRYDAVLSEI